MGLDQPGCVTQEQQDDEAERQADAPGQRAYRAFLRALVFHQVVHGLDQGRQDRQDGQEHHDLEGKLHTGVKFNRIERIAATRMSISPVELMRARTPGWNFPGLWPTLAAALAVALFVGLGIWQLQRADYKDRLHADYLQRVGMPVLNMQQTSAPETVLGRRLRIQGQPIGTTLLLDNRVRDGRAGYEVFVPYRLAGRTDALLVHTGWVPAPAHRADAPALSPPPSGAQTGIALSPPRSGWAKAGQEELAPLLYRVQRLDLGELSGALGLPLLPFLLTLEADGAWMQGGGAGGVRSRGYAVQWFGLALAACIVYAAMAYKRKT